MRRRSSSWCCPEFGVADLGARFARAQATDCLEPGGASSLASHKPRVSEMLLSEMLRCHGLITGQVPLARTGLSATTLRTCSGRLWGQPFRVFAWLRRKRTFWDIGIMLSLKSSQNEAIVVLIGRGHCCFDWPQATHTHTKLFDNDRTPTALRRAYIGSWALGPVHGRWLLFPRQLLPRPTASYMRPGGNVKQVGWVAWSAVFVIHDCF